MLRNFRVSHANLVKLGRGIEKSLNIVNINLQLDNFKILLNNLL